MKIVCENCGAKYSIADEKVKGKVFKIRCKKCSESILVRGDAEQPAEESEPAPHAPMPAGQDDDMEAETRVFDYAGYNQGGDGGEGEAIWHIVVDDQQQGPYTTPQIKEYIQGGSLATDSLIWREGFDDWMVVSDVPEFVDAMPVAAAPSSGGGGLFDEQPASQLFNDAPAGGGLFDSAGAGGSPFESGGGLFSGNASSGPLGEDVFSSTPEQASDGGLFGNAGKSSTLFSKKEEDSSNEGIFSSTKEPALAASPAGPRVSAEQAMMTGQRNENSVLFSLSNLQALAAGPAKDKSADSAAGMGTGFASPTGAAGEEASGLIDIRALAGSLSTSEQDNSVDDLISMGGGGFSPALGAPVLAAQHDGLTNTVKIAIAGGAVAILALVVVVLVVVLSGDDEAQTAAQAQITALQKQIEELSKKGSSAENDEALAKLKEQLSAKQEAAKGSGENNNKTPSAADAANEQKDDGKKSGSGGKKKTSSSSKSSSSSSSSSSTSSASSSQAGSSSSSSAPTPSKSKTSELDDLLGGPSKPKNKPSSSGSSNKPSGGSGLGPAPKASLSRSDVQNGMSAVAPAVKSCGQGKGGTITMNITIGKTGRVSSASATGAFAGTPVGNCAARAVRRAKFPSSQQNLNVKYPFKL